MSSSASATIYVPLKHLKTALEAAWELSKLPGVQQEMRGVLVLPDGQTLPTPFKSGIDRAMIRSGGHSPTMYFQFWAPRPEESDWMELDRIKVRGVRCFRFDATLDLATGDEFASISVSVDCSAETATFAQESSLVRLGGIATRGESIGAIVNINGVLFLRDGDFDFVSETDFFPDNVRGIDNQANAIAKLLEDS